MNFVSCRFFSHTPVHPHNFYRRRTLEQQLERLQCSPVERADALKELGQNETTYHRIRRQKMSIDDFILVKVIGRGAFGEVRLCRSRADPEQL